jgi:long-chain acyl-CoA synthetase
VPQGLTHVYALVERAAANGPEHPALVDVTRGTTLTWADLHAAAGIEAERLRAAGVTPGDRVAVLLPNGEAFGVAVFGALRAGAVVVPIGPGAVARELEIILGDATPRVVVAGAGESAVAAAAAGVGAQVLPPPPSGEGAAATGPRAGSADGAREASGDGGEAIALLVYTSGTTGRPRGVRLSHRALLANRAQLASLRPSPVTPTDRVLLALPLFHVFGLAAGLLQVSWAGATVVLTERFDADTMPDLLVRQRVSAIAGVPSMYRALLDVPAEQLRAGFAGVRICTSGGAPLPAKWFAAFHDATGLDIVEGYGLSEAGPVVTSNQVGGAARPGSVGRPLPGVELRLVDAEGRPLTDSRNDEDEGEEGDVADVYTDPADDTGLVALRGPSLFSGYWPDGEGGPDADGWFRTADVGYLDGNGDLHLVDRTSDLVIVNGFNVYPREVEQVLAELAEVAEAAVIGIPDDRTGAAVKAVIVRTPGSDLTEEQVVEHCALRLARFKRPTTVAFVDELPRTPTGKIARRTLAEV